MDAAASGGWVTGRADKGVRSGHAAGTGWAAGGVGVAVCGFGGRKCELQYGDGGGGVWGKVMP